MNINDISDCYDGSGSVISCVEKFCGSELKACLAASC